jgi:hypothetical protein
MASSTELGGAVGAELSREGSGSWVSRHLMVCDAALTLFRTSGLEVDWPMGSSTSRFRSCIRYSRLVGPKYRSLVPASLVRKHPAGRRKSAPAVWGD